LASSSTRSRDCRRFDNVPDVVNKLVDFILSILRLFQAWTVVDQFEGGVRLRLGKYSGDLEPGFHLMIPGYIDQALTASTVPGTYGMEEQSLTTKDGVDIILSAAVLYCIQDPGKFLLTVEDLGTVFLPLKAEISRLVRGNTWAHIQAMDLSDYLTEFALQFEHEHGVEVLDVILVDTVSAMSLRLFSAASLQSE